MPNWCYNTLTVTGLVERVDEFEEYAQRKRSKVLHEEAFKPYPRKFKKADKEHQKAFDAMMNCIPAERDPSAMLPPDGFNNGGYDWCVKNWGTKWGICEPHIADSLPGTVQYEFDTAWSPPIPLVITMSKKFPDLRFELYYEEQGMDFQGTFVVEGGNVTLDEQGHCDHNDYYNDDEENDGANSSME